MAPRPDARRGDPEAFGPPGPSHARALKARAKTDDDLLAETYELGRREGRSQARRPSSRRPSSRARGRSRLRRQARSVAAPARAQVASTMQLLGLSLGLVALYTVLENASTFSGVLGALGRGVRWLGSPDTAIPYHSPT